MTYRSWIRNLDWSDKWFVVMILIRPVADALYFVKNINPLLSPLYYVGVVTIALSFVSVLRYKKLSNRTSLSPAIVAVFTAYAIFGCIVSALKISLADVDALMIIAKLIYYPAVLFYSGYFLSKLDNYHGMVVTFHYSTYIPILMLLYELLFGAVGEVTISRGATRYQGFYADVVSYGVYLVMFVCSSLYLLAVQRRKGVKITIKFSLVLGIGIAGLIAVSHVATALSIGAAITIFYLYTTKKNVLGSIVVLAASLVTYVIVETEVENKYGNMIDRELEVVTGDRPAEQGMHGRISRWMNYYDMWLRTDFVAKVFGVAYDVDIYNIQDWAMGSVHNDYLRIMFFLGVSGLSFYLIMLIIGLAGSVRLQNEFQLINMMALIWVVLYSMSTLPTLYMSMANMIAPVMLIATSKRKY